MTNPRPPRRPAFRDPGVLDALGTPSDPIAALHAAHETAATLLGVGHAADDPDATRRLVALVDEVGLPTLADLWAHRPADTLPGALYRLYVLRTWMHAHPDEVAREYAAGIRFVELGHAVAGVEPPGPDEVRAVADAILRGAFSGDLGLALDRAAAFCLVVVAGRADLAPGRDGLRAAGRLQDLARDLAAAARLWRAGDLT